MSCYAAQSVRFTQDVTDRSVLPPTESSLSKQGTGLAIERGKELLHTPNKEPTSVTAFAFPPLSSFGIGPRFTMSAVSFNAQSEPSQFTAEYTFSLGSNTDATMFD